MGTGSGKGKTILFGEHFVVYGLPALAAGIAAETTAKLTRVRSFGHTLVDNRPAMPSYKETKYEEQKASLEIILKHLNIDTTKMGILQTPPEVAPEERVFRIDQLGLRMVKPSMTIDYAGISDGEHQLLQVIGTILLFGSNECLFLLDEPETHLNPTWRTNFAAIVDMVAGKGKHEFVISTHSPFLVSECKSRNVLFFERFGKTKSKVRFREVDFETFGSSFDSLLCNLFDMKALIPERVLEEMKQLVKSDDAEELKNGAMAFGESFEKRFIFQRIAELENQGKDT